MTILTYYGTNIADGTLASASQMVTATGSGIEVGVQTKYPTNTGPNNMYGEVWSQGNNSLPTVASIPATPTGNGWIFYPGAGTFATGNWSAITTNTLNTWGGTGHTSLTMRFFLRSAGSYTLIGSLVVFITGLSKTVYTYPAGSMGSVTVGASDGIYTDVWLKNDNLYAAFDNPTNYVSSTASGVANDFVITTADFTASGATQSTRNALGRVKVSTTTPATLVAGQTFSNSLTASGVVSNFIFGAHDHGEPGMSVTYPSTAAINAVKNLHGPPILVRTFITNAATDQQLSNKVNAILACNGVPLICLQTPGDATFNAHVVTYMGNTCNLYEFGNEVDGGSPFAMSLSAYTAAWNAQIPHLRSLNPNASFMGAGGSGLTFTSNWLDNCKASGVVPDGVTLHWYPCHNATSASACLTTNPVASHLTDFRNAAESRFPGRGLALGLTEYNVDYANPMVSYSKTEPFIDSWVLKAMQSLVNAHADFGCFFSLFGTGNFNMVDTVSGATNNFYVAFRNGIAALYNPAPPPPVTGVVYATDTFVRANNASTWGTASDGTTTYSIASGAATLAISGNEGVVSGVTSTWSAEIFVGTASTATIDMRYRCALSNAANQIGIFANFVGVTTTSTMYRVRATGSTGDMRAEKRITGGAWTLIGAATTIPTLVASTYYNVHMQVLNGVIKAKIWADGESEPASWQLTVTDGTPLAAGKFGLHVYEAGTGDTWSFDHLLATDGTSSIKTRNASGRVKISGATTKTRNALGRAKIVLANTVVRNAKGRMKVVVLQTRNASGRVVVGFPTALPIAVLRGATNIPILQAALSFEQRIDDVAGGSFVVLDTGTDYALAEGQRIRIIDTSISKTLYHGFIDKADEQTTNPSAATSDMQRTFTLKDLRYLAEKRLVTQDFSHWTAGDIAVELHRTVLASEGVVAQYAMERANDGASFANATLSGLSAKNGYLELARAGIDVVDSDDTTSDFAAGTLTNVVASNNSLQLASYPAIKLAATAGNNIGVNQGNYYTYWTIWAGSLTINSGDYLEYSMWMSSVSVDETGGIDIQCTDKSCLKDTHWPDQQGIDCHPGVHMQGWADDQWLYRKIPMPPSMYGKTMATVRIAIEGDKNGYYAFYVRGVHYKSSGGTMRAAIFDTTLQRVSKVSNIGYFNISLKVVTAYAERGSRIAPALALTPVGIIGNSALSWTAATTTQPASASNSSDSMPPQVLIESSFDGGDTWQTCESGKTIPSLPVGMNVNGKSLLVKQTLAIGGPNPELPPVLQTCTTGVESAYQSTKTDVNLSYAGGEMTDGTNTNCGYQAAINTADGWQRNDVSGLKQNGWRKNWRTGEMPNTPVYGAGAQSVGISNGELYLQCQGASGTAQAHLTDAGNYYSMILECDVMLGTADNCGLLYSTSFWGNALGSWGYYAYMSPTGLALDKGTNSSGGGGSTLWTLATTFDPNHWYHLKVVRGSDNIHHIFVDDVEYITITDGTYTSSSGVGMRMWKGGAGGGQCYFDNFGVSSIGVATDYTPANGTRTAPSVSLAPAGSVGDSRIWWLQNVPAGCTLDVQTSINGGSTYASCTNGAVIPGLTQGMPLIGVSLLVKTILHSDSISYAATLVGVSWAVLGTFSASGTRTSNSLSIAPAGTVGSSSVSWAATVPDSGTLEVDGSINGVAWTQMNAGDAISGLTQQSDMWWDSFDEDSSSAYTQV